MNYINQNKWRNQLVCQHSKAGRIASVLFGLLLGVSSNYMYNYHYVLLGYSKGIFKGTPTHPPATPVGFLLHSTYISSIDLP